MVVKYKGTMAILIAPRAVSLTSSSTQSRYAVDPTSMSALHLAAGVTSRAGGNGLSYGNSNPSAPTSISWAIGSSAASEPGKNTSPSFQRQYAPSSSAYERFQKLSRDPSS